MTYFLESDRIYLREVNAGDITQDYYNWMHDEEINRYMETRFFPQSAEQIEQYVKAMTDDPNQFFFAICKKDIKFQRDCYGSECENAHIGNVKLGPVDWIHRRGDVSLFIGQRDLWGQGYATEAIKLVCDFAFKRINLHKVTAGVYSENQASIAAFTKAGFETEGRRIGQYFIDGHYDDLVLMGRLRDA